MTDPQLGLGRLLYHPEGNRNYPVRATPRPAGAGIPPLPTRPWWTIDVFDQGSASSCTSQAEAGVLVTSPLRCHIPKAPDARSRTPNRTLGYCRDAAYRHAWYRHAQLLDPWPGDEDTAPRY